jgi:3-phenylpropionate/trans-cinnamate dioxygenase ferredoxin subunit
MKIVKIKDKEILIANVDGSFHAIANPCTHRGGDLSKGALIDNVVTCPVHGSRFDVITGKSLSGPKTLFFRTKTNDATSLEIRVNGKDILMYQRSDWGI